jgi:hypothetical protein
MVGLRVVDELGDAEVEYLGSQTNAQVRVLDEKDVVGLEVTANDAALVRPWPNRRGPVFQ